MFQPSVLYPAKICLLAGFSCTTTFVTGGAIGVLLKSKIPAKVTYADNEGFFRADLMRFIVMFT